MGVSIPVRLSDEEASRLIAVVDAYGKETVLEALAVALAEFLRQYYYSRNFEPNKRGWPSMGFWGNIAAGTQGTVDGGEAVVSLPYPMRQKIYGGPILPVNRKYLAWAENAEAYGKKPEEFAGLKVGYFPGLGLVLYLSDGTNKVPMFSLHKGANQAPDPRALPSDEEIAQALRDAVGSLVLS